MESQGLRPAEKTYRDQHLASPVLPSGQLASKSAKHLVKNAITAFINISVILFATSLVVTLATTPLAGKIAWHFGAVDYPSRRRVNTKPTPRMGGIAVMLGILAAVAVWIVLTSALGWDIGPQSKYAEATHINIAGVTTAIAGLFLVGAIDDVKGLTPHSKFFWQVVMAIVADVSGVIVGSVVNPITGDLVNLGFLAHIISVIYLVSFANIINLIDGLDGLATGIAALAGVTFFVVSVMAGRLEAALFAAIIVGASLGFLKWNFNPAKIFLGDAGSLLLGFCIGIASLMQSTYVTGVTTLIIPLIIVGVPVLDTFAAIVRRSRVGVSIGQADKGHIHHRLLNSGNGQRATVAIMYAWTVLLCLCAVTITQVSIFDRVIIAIAALTASFLLAMHLHVFVPVIRNRFDPEIGENEIVPIGPADGNEDYTAEELNSMLLGGLGEESPVNGNLPKTSHPLHILAVSQHYWPEPFAIPDVCEGLVAMGHKVTVLTGVPNYPDGDIYPGYEHGAQISQEHNGVHIKRVKIVPRGREVWTRVINYYSFSIRASRIARNMGAGYDVVLSFQTSPVMMSRPALAYGKKHDVPVLLWCMDIWPECLTVGNIKRGSLVYRYYAQVSRRIYSSADLLAIASKRFEDYYKTVLKMQDPRTVYLPQQAEDIFDEDAPSRDDYDRSKINLTFAGNVGVAQAVNTFVEAGHYLADDDRFVLHIVGSGSELNSLKAYTKQLGADNVVFHGRFPLGDMPSFYGSSDALVATFQNNAILGYTLPRKITSYMAAGRPILGTVVGEARRVVEEAGCGLCCDAEDSVGLARICRQFADMTPEEREAMGRHGRVYYEKYFARAQFFGTLDSSLVGLVEGIDT